MDREENSYLLGKATMVAHDVFNSFKTPALKLFCTQSSHGQIGKQTSPAEPWTLKTIGYYRLTSSPAHNSIFKTNENFTLQNQRKCQVLFGYHVPESLASSSPTSPSPMSPSPTSPSPRSPSPESPNPKSPNPKSPNPKSPSPKSPSLRVPSP